MKKIVWGEKASYTYFDEIERIEKLHTAKEVVDFIILVNEVLYDLETEVLEVAPSESTGICSFVISKQTTLFFDANEEESRIELLLFWRNREDPKKLVKFLNEVGKK